MSDELQVYKDELRLANAEIERLRAALREICDIDKYDGVSIKQAHRIARRALDGEDT